MTDPFDDPPGRWGLIFYGSGLYRPARSRQDWAQLADAIATADLLRAGKPGVRGDAVWCQVAVHTYTRLHDAGAYGHLRPGDQPWWYADEHLIRAWLGAPVVPPGDQPYTMLDAHGWQDTFDPARTPDPADLTLLVDLAQHAGVVGAPLHKVSLLRWVDGGVFRDDAFLVVLWMPDDPARGSSAVAIDDLLPPASSATDRIVGLFAAVAGVANRLLSATGDPTPEPGRATPALSADQRHAPVNRHGRPFQVINGGGPATAPAGPPPPPSVPLPPRRPRT